MEDYRLISVYVLGPAFREYGETCTRRPRFVSCHDSVHTALLVASGIREVFSCPAWIELNTVYRWNGIIESMNHAFVWPPRRQEAA